MPAAIFGPYDSLNSNGKLVSTRGLNVLECSQNACARSFKSRFSRNFVGDVAMDGRPVYCVFVVYWIWKIGKKVVKNNYCRKFIVTVDLSVRVECPLSLMCELGPTRDESEFCKLCKNVIKTKSGNQNLASLSRYFRMSTRCGWDLVRVNTESF